MPSKRKRLRAGDILALALPEGFAHIQYIGKHPRNGDAVLVVPGIHDRPSAIDDLELASGYVTFYPATFAASEGLIDVVGHLPARDMPDRFRRAGKIDGGRIQTWIIEDSPSGNNRQIVSDLTDELAGLPVAGIWNHAYLVEKILQGWRPEFDALQSGEATNGNTVSRESDPRGFGHTQIDDSNAEFAERLVALAHYFYFPERRNAREVATKLQAEGLTVDERLGADQVNWLVLARHEVELSEDKLEELRESFETLATENGGEYDGWEAAVHK